MTHHNIALVGRSGSGKTSVAEYLAQHHGYVRLSTGDICRHVCQLLFCSEKKGLMNAVTDALRTVKEDVWIKAALRSAPVDKPLVFDSMRFRCDYDELVANGFLTWRVECDARVRHERMLLRGQEFEATVDDHHPAENDLQEHSVDFRIVNNGSIAVLHQMIEEGLGCRPSSST